VTSGAAAPAPAPKSQLSAAAEQVLLAFFSLQDSLSKDEARMLAQRVRYLTSVVTMSSCRWSMSGVPGVAVTLHTCKVIVQTCSWLQGSPA
jgi:hypothetical protein